jgi:hypothetical protein
MDAKLKNIEIGFHLYLEESGNDCGAVRRVAPGDRDELVVYIQNEGNFIIPSRAVRSVHDSKVTLDRSQLDNRVREAILRAGDK